MSGRHLSYKAGCVCSLPHGDAGWLRRAFPECKEFQEVVGGHKLDATKILEKMGGGSIYSTAEFKVKVL